MQYQLSHSASVDFFGGRTPSSLIQEFGSPLYVYNEKLLRQRALAMKELFSLPGCFVSYSTKANANPHLLRIIRESGLHADAMSPGELALLHQAGFVKDEITYVCNNVSAEELAVAERESGIVSVDSLSQLDLFASVNPGKRVMLRVNPGIGAGHHASVITAGGNTKFGMAPEDLPRAKEIAAACNVRISGLNQHVGSLFMQSGPYLAAVEWLLKTAEQFETLDLIDFGGGFGIPYRKSEKEPPLDLALLGRKMGELLENWVGRTAYKGRFCVEPGRYIVAESAILLGTVHAVKNNGTQRYAGTDLGFSVLIRPLLYGAFHDLELYPGSVEERPLMRQTIVGNICESGDILAQDRMMPEIKAGDLLGVLDAGAYAMSMSSNYNQRLRPAEILIGQNGAPRLIRRRETFADLSRPFVL